MKKLLTLGLVAVLSLVGFSAPMTSDAGEARVIATIQTGPEWEPLGRGEPTTVPEVHYRVKHSPYKSELVRYGQFQVNEA